MTKLIRPALTLLLSLALALTVVAFSASASTGSAGLSTRSGAAFFLQLTSTPTQAEDRSEIGSTDGLTLMGFIIVTIIVVPLILKRRSWSQA